MAGNKDPGMDLYRQERRRQKPADMLRQLWRAVEQSADLVIITDRAGIVEYVNPAFRNSLWIPARPSRWKTP